MERRLTKGFWLESNSLTSGSTILDGGNGNLTASVAAIGSNNRIGVTITNDDSSSFSGSAWVSLYPRDGIMTQYISPS